MGIVQANSKSAWMPDYLFHILKAMLEMMVGHQTFSESILTENENGWVCMCCVYEHVCVRMYECLYIHVNTSVCVECNVFVVVCVNAHSACVKAFNMLRTYN